jgi:hypothetical protein
MSLISRIRPFQRRLFKDYPELVILKRVLCPLSTRKGDDDATEQRERFVQRQVKIARIDCWSVKHRNTLIGLEWNLQCCSIGMTVNMIATIQGGDGNKHHAGDGRRSLSTR